MEEKHLETHPAFWYFIVSFLLPLFLLSHSLRHHNYPSHLLSTLLSAPVHSLLFTLFSLSSYTLKSLSAYLWSHCSFPSRSPTPRSPGFSSPAGPRILRMRTPVQVVHTREKFKSVIWKRGAEKRRVFGKCYVKTCSDWWWKHTPEMTRWRDFQRPCCSRFILQIIQGSAGKSKKSLGVCFRPSERRYLIKFRIKSLFLHCRLVLWLFPHVRLQEAERKRQNRRTV